MPQALIALGSNLGDRPALLDRAIAMLRDTAGVGEVRVSRWHATQPIGGPPGQPEFLNGAAWVNTTLAPNALSARLREIETSLGRRRAARWSPRTIDLDLLLYDALVLDGPLVVPHPRMSFRRFVLEPAAEVAAEMVHPTIGWTVRQMRDHLRTAPAYVAVSGALFRHTHHLAARAAVETGWQLIELPHAGDETVPTASPSFTVARAIEFLHEQAVLLARVRRTAGDVGVISSFWIEDLLAIGDVLWPGALDEMWHTMADRIVPPKLLVRYEAPPNVSAAPAAAAELWQRFQQAQRNRASRPGLGPVLWLAADDPLAAEAELVAAIQAMQTLTRNS